MDRLAIEFICVFGMPPVRFIELAARLDCPRIGIAPEPVVTLPGRYDPWSLRTDHALRRDVAKALNDNGVAISLGEGFLLMSQVPAERLAADMDILAELGTKRINAVCLHADFAANVDSFGRFADMAGERGLSVTVEFMPGVTISSLSAADALVAAVNRSNAGLLLDAMHLFRSGATVADLAAIDPARIGYAQLCDVPLTPVIAEYADEARYERMLPGDGELPLTDFIKTLPEAVPVGIEIPQRSLAEQGVGAAERLGPALAKARMILSATG